MALLGSTSHLRLLLVTTIFSVFVCEFARADEYYPPPLGAAYYPPPLGVAYYPPPLGAAGVIANEFVPAAADEEGETTYENSYPQGGVGGHDQGLIFDKALECFNDKYIYSSCEEAYRLTQKGELNVPFQYTDQYCSGPCLKETQLVLNCIHGIFKHFEFYNGASLKEVRETIETGCSYGPKRGEFNVAEHIEADGAIVNKMSSSVFYAHVLMIVVWHVLF